MTYNTLGDLAVICRHYDATATIVLTRGVFTVTIVTARFGCAAGKGMQLEEAVALAVADAERRFKRGAA